MRNNRNKSIFAFILSIIGFLTGIFIIGIILDIIAIVFAIKAIRKDNYKYKLSFAAIGIAVLSILLTSWVYSLPTPTKDEKSIEIVENKSSEQSSNTKKSTNKETLVVQDKNSSTTVQEKEELEKQQELEKQEQIKKQEEAKKQEEIKKAEELKKQTETAKKTEQAKQEDAKVQVKQDNTTFEYQGVSYKIIAVDGGDTSGTREANVAVDIGFGDRIYWALTNEYGQLVYVLADSITLQDDETEPVNKNGRYYSDEANVKGTELKQYDQGHVIADSLGGVSNAYNITPQESILNRYGDQAYMEEVIRKAGGCTNFVATITYADIKTQIPSIYKYQYTVKGNEVTDEFPNANPEGESVESVQTPKEEPAPVITPVPVVTPEPVATVDEAAELSRIDTNLNGQVTIAEAKAAGFSMPIYSDFWLYKYMDDRDGDGMVGE